MFFYSHVPYRRCGQRCVQFCRLAAVPGTRRASGTRRRARPLPRNPNRCRRPQRRVKIELSRRRQSHLLSAFALLSLRLFLFSHVLVVSSSYFLYSSISYKYYILWYKILAKLTWHENIIQSLILSESGCLSWFLLPPELSIYGGHMHFLLLKEVVIIISQH